MCYRGCSATGAALVLSSPMSALPETSTEPKTSLEIVKSLKKSFCTAGSATEICGGREDWVRTKGRTLFGVDTEGIVESFVVL